MYKLKLKYICIYVENMEISIYFYKNILKLEPASDSYNSNFYSFTTGQTTLALEPNGFKKDSKKSKEENPVLIQFHVSSLEELESFNSHLEEHNIPIFDRSKQTEYGIITNFCDPDGNKLEVIYS